MKKTLALIAVVLMATIAHADLWINEVDYDTAGTDSNEWVEIVGTAGTSLDAYELVFINGADGSEYNTFDLAGASWTFSDEGNGHGYFVVGIVQPALGVSADYTPAGWTSNEIQNGAPDSVQLRLKAGPVDVHLLDYEGNNTFTTEDQWTALADNSTDAATSLFLTGGPGSGYADFTWAVTTDSATPGALNAGQTIVAIPEPTTFALFGVALGIIAIIRRRIH